MRKSTIIISHITRWVHIELQLSSDNILALHIRSEYFNWMKIGVHLRDFNIGSSSHMPHLDGLKPQDFHVFPK